MFDQKSTGEKAAIRKSRLNTNQSFNSDIIFVNFQNVSNSTKIDLKKDEFLNNIQYLLPNRKSSIRFQKYFSSLFRYKHLLNSL